MITTYIPQLVWYVMSGLKPLFNLSVYFEFRAFMTFLGPKELTKVGSIFFDPPNPLYGPLNAGTPLKSGENINFLISGQIFMCGIPICSEL